MPVFQIDPGTAFFVIYWLLFLILLPIILGITKDLGVAEKEAKEEG